MSEKRSAQEEWAERHLEIEGSEKPGSKGSQGCVSWGFGAICVIIVLYLAIRCTSCVIG